MMLMNCHISYYSVLKCCQMNWKRENRGKNYAYGNAVGIDTLRSHQEATRGRPMPTAYIYIYADGFAVGIALPPG